MVIHQQITPIKRQIHCYFTCIHSFVNIKKKEKLTKKLQANLVISTNKKLQKQRTHRHHIGNLPQKISCSHTPMFQLEVFGRKRSQKNLKKILQKICLKTLMTNINILKNNLLIIVYYCIHIINSNFLLTNFFSSRNFGVCVLSLCLVVIGYFHCFLGLLCSKTIFLQCILYLFHTK